MEASAILTDPAHVRAFISEAVRSAITAELPGAVRRATAKPYLTKADLMDLTGWSSRQVEYKKAQRELTFVRRGRTVLFPADAVHAYLDEATVPARVTTS